MRRLAPSTCRQRASQLRRFAEWLDGPGAGAASLADAVDAYAESRFRAGASVATVAGDLGAIRWYAGASGIEAAASLGAASLGDAKRDHDRRRRGRGQAAALRWAAADQVARRAARDGTPKGLRDAALVAVASDLCARVSEVAALRVRDVTTAGDGSAALDVWSVKTGTARTGYLRASTVRRVRAWDRCGRDRQRVAALPVDGPVGPGQAAATGHAAASRRGRDPEPGRRRRNRPGLRTLAPGRGRRLHGTARGQSRSDAASRGVAVAGHARPLRPPGVRQPGSRRHPPAGRPMGVAGALIAGARGRAPERCRLPMARALA